MATKTVTLNGTEQCVDDLSGDNTLIVNNSEESLYASAKAGVAPYADGVTEIKAGDSRVVLDTKGTVYLLGNGGRAELTGTRSDANFNPPPRSSGCGGGASEESVLMPDMSGITGYFIPPKISAESGRWENYLDGNDMILENGYAEKIDDTLHICAGHGGTLNTPLPLTIYAVFRLAVPYSQTTYAPIITKGISRDGDMLAFDLFSVGSANRICLNTNGCDIESDINSREFHVVCGVAGGSEAEKGMDLYVDGVLAEATKAAGTVNYIADQSAYTGTYYINGKVRGSTTTKATDVFYKMCAFGPQKHTPEQVALNSAWLISKYTNPNK
ncbi:MAG: hypothetical protein K2G32_05750 [Oscillospiraceae bacterium]|nr:hypothetical protein [Oscillospiraceae bacterium]